MKLWFRLTIVCWALVCLFLSLSQQLSRNHQPHLVCSKPWIDRCREAAPDSPTAAMVSSREFDPVRAGPLTSLVLDSPWTAGNIGPPGQETHGPPEPIEPWRVASSKPAAQRKHRATFFQEILGQSAELKNWRFATAFS